MDDLISRQAALEKVRTMQTYKLFKNDDMLLVDKAEVQTELMMLPSVQPVATDTNVGNNSEIPNSSDCISRQQAIDIVVFECGKWTGLAKEISKQLKQLPPAQPELQEGHWIEGKIYRDVIECYCSECGQLMTTAATVRMNYCPNCGARMVKGERQK